MDTANCKQNLRETHLQIMRAIGNAAKNTNVQCYAVGGLVRDCLTNRISDDLDVICTDITPVITELTTQGIGKNITSQKGITKKHFRSNILLFPQFNNEKVDFIEPRKEIYQPDSIKPIVEKGTLEDDVYRRDFTVNTLRLGLTKDDWLQVYDPTGIGLNDLEQQILRTPRDPEITFQEDSSRMLRAVRFARCHQLEMVPELQSAIQTLASDINRVPSELIHKELMKGAKCPKYYRTMHHVNLLDELFPEVTALQDIMQHKDYHTTDALEHTLRYVEYLPHDAVFRTAGLLHDIGKATTTDKDGHAYKHAKVGAEQIVNIGKRLRFAGDEIARIKKLVKNHMLLHQMDINQISEKGIRRFIQKHHDIYPELQIMSRADIRADSPTPEKYLRELDQKIVRIDQTYEKMRKLLQQQFKLAIDGHVIMEYGWKGPKIGEIKRDLKAQVIDGNLENDPDTLRNYLTSKYGVASSSS